MDEMDDIEIFDSDDLEHEDHEEYTPELETRSTISYSEWERPKVPAEFDPTCSSLSFQQLDMDHYIGKPLMGMPGAKIGPVPVIR